MKYFSILVLLALIAFAAFSINKSPDNQSQTSSSPSNKETITGGEKPKIPFNLEPGFQIRVFASDLDRPRVLEFSPGGVLLTSDIGSNEVMALPDKNNDGVADTKKVVLDSGNHIHGIAFFKDKLYIAEVDKVVRYNWDEENLEASQDKVLFSLPKNGNHNNRTLTFDKSGNMYVSVGSTCNVCIESSEFSATVIKSNANGDNPQVYASCLRNAPFTLINPESEELWGTEMGRDNLGDNIPPDEINIIRQGKNYGWPYCYGDKIHDSNFDKKNEKNCENTEVPIFTIPAHSAPLGLAFVNSEQFPKDWQGDLLVAYHGSWNRSTPIGYKVVHLKVNGNKIAASEDFLTGFQQGNI